MRMPKSACVALIALAGLAAWPLLPAGSGPGVTIEPPRLDGAAGSGVQTAVLAGGCFWGVQAVYQHTKGVKNAVSGYSGGGAKDAEYKAVSAGRTKHAEAVHITFDPREV